MRNDLPSSMVIGEALAGIAEGTQDFDPSSFFHVEESSSRSPISCEKPTRIRGAFAIDRGTAKASV